MGPKDPNASSFSQLKTLSVIWCPKLENVTPPAHFLPNSEGDIYCSNTAAVTGRASELWRACTWTYATVPKNQTHMTIEENLDANPEVSVQVLPRITRVCPLVRMTLSDLPSLKNTRLNFKDHSGAVSLYTNLESLEISDGNSLENVFTTECDEIRDVTTQGLTWA